MFHPSNRIGLIIVLVRCMRGSYAAFPSVVFFIVLISVTGPGILPQTSFVCARVIDIEFFWVTALPESVHDCYSFPDRRKPEICVISDFRHGTNVRPLLFCDVTKRALIVMHVSGHLVAPIFKGQAVEEGWICRLSGNVRN
jgi:hypothetical protein